MEDLAKTIRDLQSGDVGRRVQARLEEFSRFKGRPWQDWFSELSFCILAANAKGHVAFQIQQDIGAEGLLTWPQARIVRAIRARNHRFHNNKASFIVEARAHGDIKSILARESDPRRWLVDNVKGVGYKEASHFLRNTGDFSKAILDRHVLRIMADNGMIPEVPKSLTPKTYLEYEARLQKLADMLKMRQGELDFYLWYMRAGDVLK